MTYGKELITAHVLAAALNLSVETIWRYTRQNKIPYIELVNRQYRYKAIFIKGAENEIDVSF